MTKKQAADFDCLSKFHPVPWYLDTCNLKSVCVKDSKGNDVYFEDFGSIPDELSSGQVEEIIGGAHALARFLVALSENPFSIPKYWKTPSEAGKNE